MKRFLSAPCILVLCLACRERPAQRIDYFSGSGSIVKGNRLSQLVPGPPASTPPASPVKHPYENDVEAIAEGKRLFDQFNCSGCHAAGGGAIGPALMDDAWIYGGTFENIYWTIVEGRPNGMPSFGGRIVEDRIRRIAAYVKSLSSEADSTGSVSQ